MIALCFPGQGSQTAGMGADLAAQSSAVAALFAQADELLGLPLTELCFEGSDDDLKPTELAQPALLTCALAALAATGGLLDGASYVAGHSLGEYSALVAAGVLSFADALRLVRRRGELMREAGAARPGTMLAVLKLDDETVARLCAEVHGIAVPANQNSPGQVVVSGEPAALEAVAVAAKAAGGRAMPLAVSGAFHSPLMAPAAEQLALELARVEFHPPRVPVVQNISAAPVTDPATLRENLTKQVTGSVRWTDSVRWMAAAGVTRMVEVGPGKVLTGLVRRIDSTLSSYNVGTVEDLAGLGAWLSKG